jgi:hypothetical protein
MPVNHEIKSHLARLLATEDLVVEHKNVQTACFNVHTRVLTLPLWEKASNTVYDLLVGHEVGHALFTPDEDWTKEHKIPPQFVNVVEDVRIERMMKRRYAGLAKTFYGGYKELNEQGFFAIANDDISTYNLADRANLYFKIGSFLNLQFTAEEKDIIDQIASTETFADVLEASEVLYKYCKKNKKKEKGKEDVIFLPNLNGMASDLIDFDDEEELDDDTDGDSEIPNEEWDGEDSEDDKDTEKDDEESEDDEEPEVKTADSLEDAIRDLVGSDTRENIYIELPELDLDKVIVPNKEIHNVCKTSWDAYLRRTEYDSDHVFGTVDNKYKEFKNSSQKEVNYLVKEFECRKAADSYARATTARTGILDCTKLHTYKYNEDLFKKVTTLADGKNHGLIFVLDWSGSMGSVMLDTVKQLFNLVWFCKKVSIPFEVYAFTNDYPLVKYKQNGKANIRPLSYEKKANVVMIAEWFSMMNILTSKTNSKTLDDQMKNIFRLAWAFSNYSMYDTPPGMVPSGTPLNESVVALHQILPKFKRDNKLQKVQCVILTDGEGSPLKYHTEVHRHWESEPYVGSANIGSGCFLRDRKTGTTYSLNCDWWQQTDVLLHNLRDKFTDINFIGIRIMSGSQSNSFIRRYTGWINNDDDYNKLSTSWKKEKSFSIKTSGYNTYFGLSSSALAQESEFSVSEDANKTQIKNAFVKSLRTKKMNKKILSEFIELVA